MINTIFTRNTTYKKILIRPFSYTQMSVGNASIVMLILLLVQVAMLIITASYDALIVTSSSLAASLCAAALDKVYRRSSGFAGVTAAVQGIIVGLLLPAVFPPVTVFFITLGTMLLTRYMFGGFANSWGNPAVVTVAVAWLIGMKAFPEFALSGSMISARNPSLMLIQNGTFPMLKCDGAITETLNSTLFKLFKVSIPEGYVSLLWDTHSVIPAFRFNLITILSSIVLFSSEIYSSLIPLCFTTVYAVLVRLFVPVFYSGMFAQGDVILALLTSGTLFYSVFVMQWYGTVPMTTAGKIIYGIIAGVIAFLIAGCGTSPAGITFTILIMNILTPVIQLFEDRDNSKKLKKLLASQMPAEGRVSE